MRRTKIVCTIGPPSRSPETLARLIGAGMNVARINMSHGTQDEHAEVVRDIRAVARDMGRPVAILQDLAGVKIRLGKLREPVQLAPGDEIELTTEEIEGEGRRFPVNYPALTSELNPGDSFSMCDGVILLQVIEKKASDLLVRVLSRGTISSHKGVNIPKGGQGLPSMTEKDARDLRFGIRLGVDWVALSFVRTAANAAAPREIMDEAGRSIPLLAKIEKQQAMRNIESILDAFDGLMVARGDLGIETPLEDVPVLQKNLIMRANRRAKPVITATQMLLSMVASLRPTRAEVSDVANAILDGTDAVMLSEETAQGQYPVETVEMIARIAESAEAIQKPLDSLDHHEGRALSIPAAIARATGMVAQEVGAELVITPTASGSSARLVSSGRPSLPILALSPNPDTVGALCLSWGVIPRLVEPLQSTDHLFELARREALATGLARHGDRVVVAAGLPFNVPGTTNMLQVLEI